MRRIQGALLPPVAGGRLRRGDLHRALRQSILEGFLERGARLPSSRQAAVDYGVSRGLVEEVFSALSDDGFLDRRVGRGTFVADAVPRVAPRATPVAASRPFDLLSRRGRSLADNAACREPATCVPFNAGIADTCDFPWKLWQRMLARSGRLLGTTVLTFADPRGLPRLRTAIAHYLAQFRAIRCDPDQIVIFNSAQQALNALAVLLLNRGDRVCIEDPCYPGARAAFELAGATIVPIPVDDSGIRVDMTARKGRRARLVYVTPSNQYPTGVALSLKRRLALVDWAAQRAGWIIEDDYDGELRFEGQPLTSIYSLDSGQRTLYIGTLNKSMFVSLRLAFALVPHALVEPLANLRTELDGFTPPVAQMAMSLFIDEGHFSSQLRRMRAVYRTKRTALIEALSPMASCGWTWPSNPAGMHVLLSHPDGRYVRSVRRHSGLELALLSTYRHGRQDGDGLFLRFGGLDLEAIRTGASTLVSAASMMPTGATAPPR